MKLAALSAAALALGLGACTTTGVGEGASRNGAIKASITWKSTSAQEGTLTVSLDTGATYSGQFFQITHETAIDHYAPLWVGWDQRAPREFASDWSYWGPQSEFVTEYTGKVLANLSDARGAHMRCRFTLRTPSSGMARGGLGRCQLPDGESIDASLSPAS